MSGKPEPTQEERRSERIGVAVTPSERRAVKAIAALRGVEDSNLLRTMPLEEIVAEFERLREQSSEPAEKVG